MDTQDDSLRSSDGEHAPLIPHPDGLELSDEEIPRLQKILNVGDGKQYSFTEAKYRGLELIRLSLMVADPKGYEHHLRNPLMPPGAPFPPPPPDSPPVPQAFPIKLDANHPEEIERALKMLAHELRFVKRKPTYWRWALVAMYEALGHTLAAHRPASFLPYTGIGQLTKLFDAAVEEHPEVPQVHQAVEEVDRLRTTYITWGVTRWPMDLKELPGVFLDCLRVIRRLQTDRETQVDSIGGILSGFAKVSP